MTTPYKTPTDKPWSVSHATRDTRRTWIDPHLLAHPHPIGPVDPLRVSPVHLLALSHVAGDLDTCTAPIRVVPPADLGVCVGCASGPHGDHPVGDAVFVVAAVDAYGRTVRDEVCPLHLDDTVRDHSRRNRAVVVEAPAATGGYDATGAGRWYDHHDRETFYAVDDSTGVVVARDVIDTWSVYLCVENAQPVLLTARMGMDASRSARERAEVLAQAYASQLATNAALSTNVLPLGVAA